MHSQSVRGNIFSSSNWLNGLTVNLSQVYYWELVKSCVSIPDCKVHGANMGPIWGRQDQSGPHIGPMELVSGICAYHISEDISNAKFQLDVTRHQCHRLQLNNMIQLGHDDVIIWIRFQHYLPFVRESTRNGGFFSQRASNTKLWGFLCYQAVEQTIELTVIWVVMGLMWRPCRVMTIGVIFNPKLITEYSIVVHITLTCKS